MCYLIGNVDPKFAAENLMVYIGQAGTWLVPLLHLSILFGMAELI